MLSIRNSIWYRCISYTTYVGLILEIINHKMYAGTSLAILGMAITFALYFGTLIIGGIFLTIANTLPKKQYDIMPTKTNIIHDIGVAIYFGLCLLLVIAIIGEGIMSALNT